MQTVAVPFQRVCLTAAPTVIRAVLTSFREISDMQVLNAEGVEGCLIWTGEDYLIRVYNADHTFTDYDIKTADLFFKITSEDVCLYRDGDRAWIDHSPSVLGKE